MDVFDGVVGVPQRMRGASDAVDFPRAAGVSKRGWISARLLPTMPVTPMIRATLSYFGGALSSSNFGELVLVFPVIEVRVSSVGVKERGEKRKRKSKRE